MAHYGSVGNRDTLCYVRFHSLYRIYLSYQGTTLLYNVVILFADSMAHQADFHISQVQAILPITVYTLGFAFG